MAWGREGEVQIQRGTWGAFRLRPDTNTPPNLWALGRRGGVEGVL